MTVVIAGAGPTGLTLAIELARRGIPVRVLDRARALFPGSRGKGLQPRTLEVFDDLGVIGAVLAAGETFPPMRLYRGAEVVWTKPIYELLGLPEVAATPAVPYPFTWLIPQWRTDQILAARFAELGGTIEFDTEVTGFAQNDEGVTVQTGRGPIRAAYLVGADGGRSTVRKVSGVDFLGGALTEERIIVGDVRVTGLDGRCCHLLTRDGDQAKRFSLWNLPGSEHFQLVVTMAPGEQPPALTLAAMQELLEQRSGRTDVVLSDLRWISEYRVNLLMAQQFRMGRVLLAGDAAHVHSPAGGQGVNTGVQDAYNLAGRRPRTRRPVARRSPAVRRLPRTALDGARIRESCSRFRHPASASESRSRIRRARRLLRLGPARRAPCGDHGSAGSDPRTAASLRSGAGGQRVMTECSPRSRPGTG
ncbi:hypothetical protein A5642_14745 [Mycolicibacterium mucogenicum]|uniref:FAD-binding domain-containing protein n=1 Tax=Mycolicibacterium mucogenicum TaxID=56689 RepID=A0A1A0MW49_MYCMU|nr:hypothetical protein A5642_14745 [Mycolicibacterium mucogenicum]